MIIEFPKKYSVRVFKEHLKVSIPAEYAIDLYALLKQQGWMKVYQSPEGEGVFTVFLSQAYEITPDQAIEALEKLCEYVMSPPVVMSDELADDLSELLT